MRLLVRSLIGCKAKIHQSFIVWTVRLVLLLLLLGLAQCALFFGLGALALYLNTLLGSSYQGWLVVAGGCAALVLLLLLLCRVYWLGNFRRGKRDI